MSDHMKNTHKEAEREIAVNVKEEISKLNKHLEEKNDLLKLKNVSLEKELRYTDLALKQSELEKNQLKKQLNDEVVKQNSVLNEEAKLQREVIKEYEMAQQTETNSDKSEVITEKDNFSLQCSECTFTSKDSKIMKGHTAAKHGAFKCSSKQSKLENHVKSIHGAHAHREYSCNKCPDTFKSENALQVHKKQYHYNKWFTCDECGSQCNKLNELEQHKAMFHNQPTQNKKMCR